MIHRLEEHSQRYNNADPLDEKINQAASFIKAARYTTVLTGAGSSTPSGIPDFRTPGSGLWTRFAPSEYASLNAFRHHPEEFCSSGKAGCSSCPHPSGFDSSA